MKRDFQTFQNFPRNMSGIGSQVYTMEDETKFITAQPCQRIFLAHAGDEAFGYFLKESISRQVPEGIVDRFEAVQIDKQNGHLFLVSLGMNHRLFQAVQEKHAVCETC